MYPILLDWGPLFLPAWHVFFALGAIATYFMVQALNRAVGAPLPPDALNRLYVSCYIAGYVGARGLNIFLAESPQGMAHFMALLSQLGAMVFYGGFLASLTVGLIVATRRRLEKGILLDLALPSVMIGLGIGRIGCFLNGDDYGKVSHTAPWATVVFPNLGDDLPRYPVQLWEAALAFGLAAWGISMLRRKGSSAGSGRPGLLLLMGYAIGRFLIELFRDDERGWVVVPWLSTSQFISVFLFFGGALIWLRLGGKTATQT